MTRALCAILAVLVLATPAATFAQASGGVDVRQVVMGPAANLPSPIAQMSSSDVAQYEEGLREGIAKVWASHGVALTSGDISIGSAIIPAGGGLKIVRSKVAVLGKSFQWVFMGAAGGNMVEVICTSRTAQPFEPDGSQCDHRVKQVFGGGN